MMVPNGLMRGHSCRVVLFAATMLLALVVESCVPPGGMRTSRGDDSLRTSITRVLNMRIHGAGNVQSPPMLRLPDPGGKVSGMGNDALTITFEMQSEQLPNISLLLVHCDRDWVPTQNMFVQDPVRLRSNDFEIERAPVGVQHYDYIVRFTFPQRTGRISIQHSGNYLARIVDYYDNERVLAEGRFFVTEGKASVGVEPYSDFYESAQTKVLQHGLKIRVEAEPAFDVFGGEVNAIHLYQSGMWYTPIVASNQTIGMNFEKGDPWVTWYPSFGGKGSAQFANLPAGNEHRLLDLTDLTLYPSTGGLLTTPLSDIPRSNFNQYDNNGITPDRYVPLSDADYVYFEFRLDLRGQSVKEDIFVVGTFNNWLPSPEWQLHYDEVSGFYIARGLIPRAFHEYQYLAGSWDQENGVLRHADPTLLEGNVTGAMHPYYAMVFYRETSGGGYDRIIGAGVDISGTRR